MEDEQEVEVVKLNLGSDKAQQKDLFYLEGEKLLKLYGGSMDKNSARRAKYRIDKHRSGANGTGSKQIEKDVTAYDILEAAIPPYNLENLAELYDKNSWNYAAINAKTANIVGLGYTLENSPVMQAKMDKLKDEPEKLNKAREKVDRLRLIMDQWIDSLNNSDLFLESITKAFIDYQAAGNGYIEIGRVASGPNKGQIGYVGHIPSSTMRVRVHRDGFVQMVDGRIKFFRNYGDQQTSDPLGIDGQPNEIIHLKNYSPTNTFYGIPDIAAAMNAVAGSEFAARYNLDFFEHRTAPRYVIIAKGVNLSASSQKSIMEFLQSGLKGKSHRSIYIPLPADRDGSKAEIKFEPVESGIQDSSFETYRRSNRDEILAVHRTPLSKLGIAESGSGVAAASDFDKTFKEVVCRPEQDVLEKKVNWIISEKTDVFRLEFNELTLTDAVDQSAVDERYLRLKSLTPNEARKHIGLGPIPGGDEVVDLKPQQEAGQRATAGKTRERDAQRGITATDSRGKPRNAQGAGESREQ